MASRREPAWVRFVELAGAIGALVGWRVAAGEPVARIACPHGRTAQTQIRDCFNRSVQATITHWGMPMLLGVVLAGVIAIGLALAVRYMARLATPRFVRRRS